MKSLLRNTLPSLLGTVTAFAGPVTTVPWNGHTGAASFTYDDARTSQLPNLVPQLDELGLKATFFIASSGTGGDFESKKPQWMQVARNGHELANHTKAHVNVPVDPNAAPIIAEMAKYLRDMDPAIESVTFAYPNCNVNGKAGINAENFISRSCGGTRYAWATQPADWMDVQGMILSPSNSASAISSINSAKSGNSWFIAIIHDVKESPDQYSVTPADNKRMLEAAKAAGVWIDTYQNIGAYYRAHFVMDAAVASPVSGGWNLAWTSPHPRMPKSVKLRVKLAAATFGTGFEVRQGATVIPPEADGSYVIDFMKLSLMVASKPTGIRSRAFLPARITPRLGKDGIVCDGVVGEVQATVVDVRGRRLFQGRVTGGRIPLRPEGMQGILFVTLADRATGTSVQARVRAVR
jgi:peptidoglycan/xylan/chitin deacetylase (PgdA/CDA1 family)